MAELLRPDVADEMGGAVCVTIDVTIETCDAAMRFCAATVLGRVELLLRERA